MSMPHIVLKNDSVKLVARHFDPEFVVVFPALLEKYPVTDLGQIVVTSLFDSHESGLHTSMRAIDVRTRNILHAPDRRAMITGKFDEAGKATRSEWLDARVRKRLAARLGRDWDVLIESVGEPEEHCHLELDPKGR